MIFFKNNLNPENPQEVFFEAVEDDLLLGKCTLFLEKSKATVKSISYDINKPYIAEGLIKSAFNYAALKNCYMGYCECENIDGFLDRLNLEKQDGIYFNDIPTILQGNCCKKH